MRFSQKGAKSNKIKLAWSKYFKYVLGDKELFIKQKAYTTHHDGWTDSQEIKKQTYRNAIKRGNNCKEIPIKENIMEIPTGYLIKMFSEIYVIPEKKMEKIIVETKKTIEHIKKDSTMGPSAEYAIFKKIIEKQVKIAKDEDSEMYKL